MEHAFIRCSTGKFSGITGKLKRKSCFLTGNFSNGNACLIYEFLRGITSSMLFTAISVPRREIILNFGDESINKWKLCQMEHPLHSMDLSMEASQSFW